MSDTYTKNNDWFDPNRYNRGIDWHLIKRFLAYYRPYRSRMVSAVVLSLLFSLSAYLIPEVFRAVQAAIEAQEVQLLVLALSGYLGVVLFQSLSTYLIIRIKTGIFTRLNQDVLLRYYQHLLNSSVREFLRFKKNSNLFQRVIDAMSTTSQVTDVVVTIILGTITVVVFGAVIGSISVVVLGILLLGVAALAAHILYNASRLRNRRQRTLGINFPLVSKMLEIINGLLTVKSLAASVQVTNDITRLVEDKRGAEYDEAIYKARIDLGSSVIRNVTLLGTVGASFVLVLLGHISLADLFAVYILITGFLGPVSELVSSYQTLSVLSVNLQNYFEVIDIPAEDALVEEGVAYQHAVPAFEPAALVGLSGEETPTVLTTGDGAAVPVPELAPTRTTLGGGGITLENVSFTYDGATTPVLRDLNLEIYPGENVALIGRSGAGKTTLTRLLLAFLEPSAGTVRVDGQDLAALPSKSRYRERFGIVGQDDFLFNINLRENLTFGLTTPRSDEDIRSVLELVNLWSAIEALPEGLDTVYNDDNFSGGQKQRLIVARALIRNPDIILLDEPTSALDFENEQEVMRALDTLVHGKTTLTIAHRLSTVQGADRVLVMDEGQIKAAGPHDELYETNEYYRALCDYNSFIV